jgi:low temperature requirement protein LtrA
MTAAARRPLHATEPQSAAFVELFFDLVFVFAVTQLTALTARNLTPDGLFRSLLLFWLIWWAWTQFTWTLNPADTTHGLGRVITLAATIASFAMAASVPRAFEEDALWFAIPYVTVRTLGLGLQAAVDLQRQDQGGAGIWRWVAGSGAVLVVVLLGAVADPSIRPIVWLLVVVMDLLATQAASGRTWDIVPAHIAERHALFVIIALGESLVLTGTALAGHERTTALVADAALSLLIASLIWWTYFGWFKEALEELLADVAPRDTGVAVRDAYSIGHVPLVVGIIGFAVGIEEILGHPGDAPPPEVIAALGAGVGLFVGFSAFPYWRLGRRVLVARLVAAAAIAAVLLGLSYQPPVFALGGVALVLLALVAWEATRSPHGSAGAREHNGAMAGAGEEGI